jgi:hypothetical protein
MTLSVPMVVSVLAQDIDGANLVPTQNVRTIHALVTMRLMYVNNICDVWVLVVSAVAWLLISRLIHIVNVSHQLML